jgi:hypothetical protein
MRTLILAGALMLTSATVLADDPPPRAVAVRHVEGLVHGFLALRDLNGALLASGDLIQTSSGGRVTSRLVFRFKDGSTQEETAVFSQRGTFRLISHKLVQKGRSFPEPLTMSIDAASGRVQVQYVDDDGEMHQEDEKMELPATLGNGLIPILLKNVRPADLPLEIPFVAATPKPRLVTLAVTAAGEAGFGVEGSRRKATHYLLKTRIGGIAGVIAPLIGKDPPDAHVWIMHGVAPAFIRAHLPSYVGGPLWRIELTRPTWGN